MLKNVNLMVLPFDKITKYAKKGDFVYFDPPYYPLKKGKSFTSYDKSAFLEEEQKKLFREPEEE